MDMDDDDFEDLLGEVELLQDASAVSLTGCAANLSFAEGADLHTPTKEDASMLDVDDDDFEEGFNSGSPRTSPQYRASAVEQEFESDEPQRHEKRPYPNAATIDKIEAVFESMTDALLNDRNEISITLKSRSARWKHSTLQDASRGDQTRRLCFPGKSEEEAWRFSMVIRIMEIMHEALRNEVVLSKRDIYYRDPALFGSQSQVDRYVDDIAFTFGVPRSALNVTAVAKGLFAGSLKLHRRDGSVTTADTDQEGLLVPNLKDILSVDLTSVKWVLVIEKEATFRSIAASDFWDVATAEGVILTGKGYPDLSSRAFLHLLATPSARNGFASPPVFGLADFDPDGLAILSTYKHGSKALAHESADHSVPDLQWLGLRSDHLHIGESDSQAAQGLLPMTVRDRKKAGEMIEKMDTSSELGLHWRQELQTMLMLNTKAELQLLDAVPNGMVNLLTTTLGKL